MAQSQNSSVYYTEKATSFHGMSTYGSVMLGNNAFEFYNERNPEDFIKITWSEIDHVAASGLFGGKKISRFAIFVKGSESGFSFSTRDNKATLRAMREHVPEDKLLRSLSFFDVIKRGVLSLFRKNRSNIPYALSDASMGFFVEHVPVAQPWQCLRSSGDRAPLS